MPSTVITPLQAAAPFLLLLIAGLCLAATYLAVSRHQKSGDQRSSRIPSFGNWPDEDNTDTRLTGAGSFLPAAKDAQVTLGPDCPSRAAGPLFFDGKDRRA
ncbi:hypothetical protein [Roseibium alexandrii]|uniref:Uncharacterized protein n=1 Tax=Roseibium alexandrii (strain DSM 17067 / NCIMB 14079 / DFL-11) TaxID=244592 RepID=A0A5E8UWF7_ROSAD|nr:hypothetical protein [Roseibium alexandrii]RMX61877.1 hypothetical protein SADFL11_00046370 [Roseibium alexandrii DFL-11]